MNILLEIAYDGTDFHGWQIQNDQITICGTLQDALSRLYNNEPIRLIGASRTDAGVHAFSYTANFHPPVRKYRLHDLKRALNAITPDSILIKRAIKVHEDFHSRFSSKGKIYQYRVSNRDLLFERNYCHRIYGELNIDKLTDYAKLFIGEHNFAAFSILKSIPPNPICSIQRSFWSKTPDGIYIYEIQGNRFLHEMVRMIVGSQLDMCSGKLEPDDIKRFLENGQRISREGATRDNASQIKVAPGKGLFLIKGIY